MTSSKSRCVLWFYFLHVIHLCTILVPNYMNCLFSLVCVIWYVCEFNFKNHLNPILKFSHLFFILGIREQALSLDFIAQLKIDKVFLWSIALDKPKGALIMISRLHNLPMWIEISWQQCAIWRLYKVFMYNVFMLKRDWNWFHCWNIIRQR
jgi:hypothetical protein